MPHILHTSANEIIIEETGDYYSVFYNAFALSTPSAEMLQNTVRHTDQKRQLVVHEHD